MALTRAQLLSGDSGQGTVLAGQPQGVLPGGTGITIRSDGIIEVNSQTIVGVLRLGQTSATAAAAFNGYTWPTNPGTPGQNLESDGAGNLIWADSSGLDWTQKGQIVVATASGQGYYTFLNVGVNTSTLVADSTTTSGLAYSDAVRTAMLMPGGSTAQRPAPASSLPGQIRFNTDTKKFEFYNGTGSGWEEVASGNPIPGGNTFVAQSIPVNNTSETGNALIPAGTSLQRQTAPPPVVGATRYNTTLGRMEVYGGSGTWETIPSSTNFDFVSQTIPGPGETPVAVIPAGATAQRETAPLAGYTRFNTTISLMEVFNGSTWETVGAPNAAGLNNYILTSNGTSAVWKNEAVGLTLTDYADKIINFGNTNGAATFDLKLGNWVNATLNINSTLNFVPGIATGASSFTLFLTNGPGGPYSIVWPASVKWSDNGVIPNRTTTAGFSDLYTFFTLDGGVTWYGTISIYKYP